MARILYLNAQKNLLAALGKARNGRRLLEQPTLRDDVAFCARVDAYGYVLRMEDRYVVAAA